MSWNQLVSLLLCLLRQHLVLFLFSYISHIFLGYPSSSSPASTSIPHAQSSVHWWNSCVKWRESQSWNVLHRAAGCNSCLIFVSRIYRSNLLFHYVPSFSIYSPLAEFSALLISLPLLMLTCDRSRDFPWQGGMQNVTSALEPSLPGIVTTRSQAPLRVGWYVSSWDCPASSLSHYQMN